MPRSIFEGGRENKGKIHQVPRLGPPFFTTVQNGTRKFPLKPFPVPYPSLDTSISPGPP